MIKSKSVLISYKIKQNQSKPPLKQQKKKYRAKIFDFDNRLLQIHVSVNSLVATSHNSTEATVLIS